MKIEAFKQWLAQQGAEVLAPTNQYEVLRVRARARVHVLYKDKHGAIGRWPDFLRDCYTEFERGKSMSMGLTATARDMASKYRAALVERDGDDCFFCLQQMPAEDMTLEHLVPVSKGGPNHMDNLVLAHRICNAKADNLPLIKKIKMRDAAFNPLADHA